MDKFIELFERWKMEHELYLYIEYNCNEWKIHIMQGKAADAKGLFFESGDDIDSLIAKAHNFLSQWVTDKNNE